MISFKTVGYVAFVAAFFVFAVEGLRGWSSERAAAVPDKGGSRDEEPLRIGFLPPQRLAHSAGMGGYPWADLRPAFLKAKTDLPPDPTPDAGVEAENRIRELLRELHFAMPEGRVPWSKIVTVLKARIEPHGIKVITPEPRVRDDFTIELPPADWTGATFLNHIMTKSGGMAVYVVTSDGVGLGPDEACNKVVRDAMLAPLRRRCAKDNAAPDLDVPFRPDVMDADLVAFLRGIQAQTGIQVAMDPQIWENGPALSWRGEPRPLREVLDTICSRFHWYWRFHDGRVWLLKS